jgi:ParB family chromosome partitioning protein
MIVAGERRFRGATIAGLEKIPALVRTLSDQHKLELSLIENIQRRDLNVLETATAYLKLRDQFNLSLEEIGKRVGGKSVSGVSNTIRLLRLPESVRQALQNGQLTEGQARPLVNADPEVVEAILPQILKEEWSARKIEQYVVNLKADAKSAKAPTSATTAESEVVTRWQNRLGADNVAIRTNSKGAGQIVIRFKSQDELKKIEERLG